MKHRVQISGADYEVTGGRVMLNGAVHEIASGNVMLNGAGYEIAFGSDHTVVISGRPHEIQGYVSINGETIAEVGTFEYGGNGQLEISVIVTGTMVGEINCYVKLNGITVLTGKGTYTFVTAAKRIMIFFEGEDRGNGYRYAEITTEE